MCSYTSPRLLVVAREPRNAASSRCGKQPRESSVRSTTRKWFFQARQSHQVDVEVYTMALQHNELEGGMPGCCRGIRRVSRLSESFLNVLMSRTVPTSFLGNIKTIWFVGGNFYTTVHLCETADPKFISKLLPVDVETIMESAWTGYNLKLQGAL